PQALERRHHRPRLMSRLRWKLRYLRGALEDLRLFVTGTRDRELPPMRLRFVGAGDFRAVGDEMVKLLTNVGEMQPGDRVLDIGCGVGRVALPLTRVLCGPDIPVWPDPDK